MGKPIRVGSFVYKDGEVIASVLLGSWYKWNRQESEMDTCDPKDAAIYDAMPDASRLPPEVASGELAVLEQASRAIGSTVPTEVKQSALEAAADGLKLGMHKYGPYEPKGDKRDLIAWATEELRDTIVYLAMDLTKEPPAADREIVETAIQETARLYARLRVLSFRRKHKVR